MENRENEEVNLGQTPNQDYEWDDDDDTDLEWWQK